MFSKMFMMNMLLKMIIYAIIVSGFRGSENHHFKYILFVQLLNV